MTRSWKEYDWDIFGSFKSCAQTAFICVIFEIAELNAFFLKSTLWIEPSVGERRLWHVASACDDSTDHLGLAVDACHSRGVRLLPLPVAEATGTELLDGHLHDGDGVSHRLQDGRGGSLRASLVLGNPLRTEYRADAANGAQLLDRVPGSDSAVGAAVLHCERAEEG